MILLSILNELNKVSLQAKVPRHLLNLKLQF